MGDTIQQVFDVLVIGGGINGAGIARDAAGRGLSVLLCEKNDLASATSSASSKMIHGGLRYLEHYEFKLVQESLKEREVLLRAAPHIISPMTFIIPHHKKLRPWWLMRAGLFIYDHLAGQMTLPPSRAHSLPGTLLGQPLKAGFKRGFSYSDCWVEDTRLVILNALGAAERGARILTHTECKAFQKNPQGGWYVTLRDGLTDQDYMVAARMIVNASGPWVERMDQAIQGQAKHHVRWVKGSHIVVPRLYKGDHAYLLQNDDRRVIFVFPYEKEYTLIGTTDVDYKGDIDEVRSSVDEVEYLCRAVSGYFRYPVKAQDVIWSYSGVRPLVEDGKSASEVSREYILEMNEDPAAPLLSVYGGKITTFRSLAEKAANKIVATLNKGSGAWTAKAPLPGGEAVANFNTFYKAFRREYNWLPEAMALRFAHYYGTRAREILRGFKRMSDLGDHFGDNVYACEINYLVNVEWALTLEDILWRRTKLGLHVSEDAQKKIELFLKEKFAAKAV